VYLRLWEREIPVSSPAMKIRPTWLLLLAIGLAACDREPSEDTAPEVQRYRVVAADDGVCVFDNRTGLTWEGKTDAAGLHDYHNTYTWYDPDEDHGELDYRGLEGGGECRGSACDTWHFVQAVNDVAFCGYADWRMPTKPELMSISDLRRADHPPTTDTEVFPYAQADEYWSANDYSFQWDAAWAWNFRYGHDRVDWKKSPKFARLVRGTAGALPEVKE